LKKDRQKKRKPIQYVSTGRKKEDVLQTVESKDAWSSLGEGSGGDKAP